MIAKCSCQHCGNSIEFDPAGHEFGMTVECPHCHNMTVITLPPVQKIYPVSAALKNKKQIEDSLDGAAGIFFGFGMVAAIIVWAIAFIAIMQSQEIAAIGFVFGFVLFFQGWIISIIFKAIAEIIRLLRVIAIK